MTSLKSQLEMRAGYTLVELLTVIAIIAVLAGMVAIFMPVFETAERAGAGAARLQQWLLIARQSATYDRAPRGLRLFRQSNNPADAEYNYITRAQYIEQPEDFYEGTAERYPTDPTQPPDLTRVVLRDADVRGGFADPALWPVQVGDYFQVHGAGLMHQIKSMDTTNTPAATVLELASPLVTDIRLRTVQYRIVRRPRPFGTETLQMPHAVGVDLTTNVTFGQPLPFNADGTIDILFSPSGAVLGNFASDRMIFWIREISDISDGPDQFFGNPSLIVVFIRSGLVESYPVDKANPSAPYSKIR